ncbi:MAG: hypothetical protein ACKVZH_09770 [Blastocatellia bacterium]
MRKIVTLTIWMLLAVPVLTQSSSPKIELLETGSFHGSEVKARSGERWLGLYVTRRGSSLITSTVKVKSMFDEIVDIEGEMTGKDVSVDRADEPIFLIKNANVLKPGPAMTVYKGGQESLHVLAEKSLVKMKLGETNYQLKVVSRHRSEGKGLVPPNAQLVFTDGLAPQTLYRIGSLTADATWYLLWAGDVDGDGKLDLYLSLSDHYNVSEHRLFLSSQAQAGQLLRQVAKFRTTGC